MFTLSDAVDRILSIFEDQRFFEEWKITEFENEALSLSKEELLEIIWNKDTFIINFDTSVEDAVDYVLRMYCDITDQNLSLDQNEFEEFLKEQNLIK